MKFLAHEFFHLSSSLAFAGYFWGRYQDWRLVVSCLFFGFFIDVDHFLDYFLYVGFRFKFKNFINVRSYMWPAKRVYVILHGWEYVLVFWLVGRIVGIPGLAWAMSLPYLTHLIFDNFSFKHHPLCYFFIYRLINGFTEKGFNG